MKPTAIRPQPVGSGHVPRRLQRLVDTLAAQADQAGDGGDGLHRRISETASRDSNGDGTLDERLYVAQDANYNVTALFDNSGNVVERYLYDPFGQVTVLDSCWNVLATSAFACLYLHQGGRFDATSGLYHFRHRDYSPTLGRWTSLDPIRYEAGDVNLYRVVSNAPTVYTDPSGLNGERSTWDYIWAGARTALTFASPVPMIIRGFADPDGLAQDLDLLTSGRSTRLLLSPKVGAVLDYATSEPSFVESIIPIWGSARNLAYHANQGNWGWAGFYAGMTILDAFLVRSIITGIGEMGWKVFTTPGWITGIAGKGALRSFPIHVGWRTWSLLFNARGAFDAAGPLGRQIILRATSNFVQRARTLIGSPALSTALAEIQGLRSWTCVTAAINAWSRSNFHLPYFIGGRWLADLFAPDDPE